MTQFPREKLARKLRSHEDEALEEGHACRRLSVL